MKNSIITFSLALILCTTTVIANSVNSLSSATRATKAWDVAYDFLETNQKLPTSAILELTGIEPNGLEVTGKAPALKGFDGNYSANPDQPNCSDLQVITNKSASQLNVIGFYDFRNINTVSLNVKLQDAQGQSSWFEVENVADATSVTQSWNPVMGPKQNAIRKITQVSNGIAITYKGLEDVDTTTCTYTKK